VYKRLLSHSLVAMNADPQNGTIKFSQELTISKSLSKSEFLESPVSTHSTVLVENPPYITYKLPVTNEISSSLCFNDEKILNFSFSSAKACFGTSWSDWSKENELKRNSENSRILNQLKLSTSTEYTWAKIWSGFDEKSGSSSVVINFT
jgi:hypothetical protein